MSTIVLSSDWHRDKRTSGFDRGPDVDMAVAQVVQKCIELRADAHVFLGDLADPDDGPAVLRAVQIAIHVAVELASYGIESWWIPGNHDVIEDGTGRTTLSPIRALVPFGGARYVRVIEHPDVIPVPGKPKKYRDAVILPYTATSHAYDPQEKVEEFATPARDRALVFGHLNIYGMQPGEETTEMRRGRDLFFPLAACPPGWLLFNGHYHRGETFERDGRQICIPGALARFTHGEERNRPRFLVLEV